MRTLAITALSALLLLAGLTARSLLAPPAGGENPAAAGSYFADPDFGWSLQLPAGYRQDETDRVGEGGRITFLAGPLGQAAVYTARPFAGDARKGLELVFSSLSASPSGIRETTAAGQKALRAGGRARIGARESYLAAATLVYRNTLYSLEAYGEQAEDLVELLLHGFHLWY